MLVHPGGKPRRPPRVCPVVQKNPESGAGNQPLILRGQESGSPLGKAVVVVRRGGTLLGACFHSDPSREEQIRKVGEVHSYRTVLA